MGAAKRRGDYETRKADAVKNGRVTVIRESHFRLPSGPELFASIVALLGTKKTTENETPEPPISTP
jgi:hypothetical protein